MAAELPPPAGTRRAAAIAAVTAFVTLATQVLVHRIVSVKLVNNFAFLVISLTMLGFALSGVVLTRWRKPLMERREEAILVSAALFVPALLLASWIFCAIPPGPQWAATRGEFVLLFLRLVPVAALYSAPFGFCGLILGLLLSATDLPARRVYGFDLAGSALGAFAVIPVISVLGAEAALLAGAAVLLAGCLLLCRARRGAVALAAASAVLLAVAFAARPWFFPMRYPEGSVLAAAQQPASGFTLEHVGWDPVARIEVTRIPPPAPDVVPWPFLVGADPAMLARFERILTQNNTAFTYAPRYEGVQGSLAGLEQTLYAGAYQAKTVPAPRVLVIGVGGGIDILAGLHHGAAAVTGVEVNGATIRILRDHYREYFRHWVDDPRVKLVEAEGRNFLSRSPETFDLIQLSGVDSASGIPGAAHVFSENYLYTSEAFDLFLSRLTPRGVLSVMRQEWRPAREMLRVLTTAIDALRRVGVARPAEHVVMLSANNGLFGSLLVKRTPFTPEEVARIDAWAARSPFFHLAAAPAINAARRNAYQIFLALDGAAAERTFATVYPFDLRPPPDARPFFFKFSRWGDLLARAPERAASVPVMEVGLLSLFAVALVAVLACVLLPLRQLAGEGLRTEGAGRHAVFFGAIAVGYMAVEMAFLQKFGLLLGHPNYSLSVVLASLLLASGLGALFSDALLRLLGGLRFVGYALAALVLVESQLVFPLLPALMGRGFALRVLVVAALVLPVGLCLGAYLPTGLQRLKSGQESFVPWAWGINGIFSVLAPILAVAVATTWGVNALLLSAIPVYLAAGFVEPRAAAAAERELAGAVAAAGAR